MRDVLLFLLGLYGLGAFALLLGWLLDECDPWWGFVVPPFWGGIVIYAIVKHYIRKHSPTPSEVPRDE